MNMVDCVGELVNTKIQVVLKISLTELTYILKHNKRASTLKEAEAPKTKWQKQHVSSPHKEILQGKMQQHP